MDSATQELYLQRIEELVWDENKIVTFKYLCRILTVNADDAKSLLEQFVKDCKELGQKSLTITYVLIGLAQDDSPVLEVVSEAQLAEKSSKLKIVLTQVIYSVQKCKEIDLNAISLIDYPSEDAAKTSIPGAVVSKLCVPRVFKVKKTIAPPPPKIVNKASKSHMFANVPPKKEQNNKEEQISKKESPPNNEKKPASKKAIPKSKLNGGISNFFSKTPEKPPEKPQKVEKQMESINVKGAEIKESKNKLKRLVDSEDSEDDFKATKEKQTPVKPTKKKQKKNKSITEESAKKRKRIITNDSDSDDIFGDENEHVKSSDDEIQNIVEATPQPVLTVKNKRRKQVDKTYTDEDGYLLTRKEWIYESASEEEVVQVKVDEKAKEIVKAKEIQDEKPVVEKVEKNGKGKAKGGKGKEKKAPANQPTLMNFFKKK